MKENVLIKSERFNVKIVLYVMLIIGLIAGITVFAGLWEDFDDYDEARKTYMSHKGYDDCDWPFDGKCLDCREIKAHPTKLAYVIAAMSVNDDIYFCLLAFAPFTVIGLLAYLWLRSYELTITDKRVYGRVAWGKRVDLPIDSVSATSTVQLLKGVSISTSSGKISFLAIKNANKIYNVISDLLIERQDNKPTANFTSNSSENTVEDLKKFKDLFDTGVITQEEYDAKKKQLLGL